jgi:hypothetical protein
VCLLCRDGEKEEARRTQIEGRRERESEREIERKEGRERKKEMRMREGGGRVPGGVRGVRETYGTTVGREILLTRV